LKDWLGGVEWIHLAQDRDHWWAVVNAVMNICVLAQWNWLVNTLPEYPIDTLTSSFHILQQRFDLFFHSGRVLHKVYVSNYLENSTLLG
jgi:hypothetical protein